MTERAPHPRGRVLVVEDETYVRESLVAVLRSRGFEVLAAASVEEASSVLARTPLDVVLSDLRMPGADGLDLVRRFQEESPDLPVVILTGHATVASAVACLRAGARDYVMKPVEPDALEVVIERAMSSRELAREVRYLRDSSARPGSAILGRSPAWRKAMASVEAAALADSTVLFLGESGTGKEVLARRLHELSPRAEGPFVTVNCAAVPLEMWESEFFGHRRGSFTGALADREGRFQLAHRGTLLLDEVGAMPAAGQAKLLRVIQDGEFDRLGDDGPTRVDVRIVAATNSDLEAEVSSGGFRADLFYRLNVVRIEVPPLRERQDDVALLASQFANEVSARLRRRAPVLPVETLSRLRAYPWPGNVRELRNVIERAIILDPVDGLKNLDLLPGGGAPPVEGVGDLNLRDALGRLERELLLEALQRARQVRKDAAALLGIDPRNLSYYLRKHGLEREE
ncbi:MAG TPA: sigma-54 dependent transcriptional regulator [Vicinamibacteria bacterium]|nr:sigma-54 dependent transcriptional regulator [Vicinamibacteria bacterium]